MSKNRRRQPSSFDQFIKKIFLSSFVVFTFVAYAIDQRLTHPDTPVVAASPTVITQSLASTGNTGPTVPTSTPFPTDTSATANTSQFANAPFPTVIVPTDTPIPTPIPPTAIPAALYRDGTFTGPTINAYYGLVSVQATIQSGKIVNVQFLQYPNDRRTSQRINSIAMPWLQQEAIQAQNANVNLISGATLTSEAFVYSLDGALKAAKN